MFGSGILDVAVGLVLAFLSVSLIASAVREIIEMLLKSRAMDLERGVRELLSDPAVTQKVFDHPLIKSLYGGVYSLANLKPARGFFGGAGPGKSMPVGARRSLPSYIPANQFAVALIDLVTQGKFAEPNVAPAELQAPLTVADLRTAAASIQNDYIKRALLSAVEMAGDDIEKVRANLESWFNGTMDRVSGWYKRRTQFILFAIGFGAAVVLNVDAVTIAQRLGSDEALRRAVVASAATIVQSGEAAVQVKSATAAPPATAGEAPAAPGPAAGDGQAAAAGQSTKSEAPDIAAELKSIAAIKMSLDSIGVPIGWQYWFVPVPQAENNCRPAGTTCALTYNWASWSTLRILLGWLITAFAVTLGAPFWFDLLNKFMTLRGTVKPEAKEKEKAAPAK